MPAASMIATVSTVSALSMFLFFKWLIKKILDKKFNRDKDLDIAKNRKALYESRCK